MPVLVIQIKKNRRPTMPASEMLPPPSAGVMMPPSTSYRPQCGAATGEIPDLPQTPIAGTAPTQASTDTICR